MENQSTNTQQVLADARNRFLLNDDNNTAAIILVEKACEQYQNLYNKNDVPYSYIKFFCEEFNKYSGLFTNKLKEFYDDYTALDVSTVDLIDRYVKSYYAQHHGVKVQDDETFLCFNEAIVLTFTKKMREVTNINVSTMVENMINICDKIDTHDEIISQVELYERYMINEFIKTYKFKDLQLIKDTDPINPVDTQTILKQSPDLVGDALEDNYQSSGRVTRVIIPKLNLPTSYPTSTDQSRLTENKKVSKLCSPAKQVQFINRKKIVNVKYAQSFLDKRAQQKKKKKFDWDF